jgi:anti-sigma B factor antagonist
LDRNGTFPNKEHPGTLLNSEGEIETAPTGKRRAVDLRSILLTTPELTHMNRDAQAFHIASEPHGEGSFARLVGSITIDSAPELRRVLLLMVEAPGGRRLTLDFSEVVYIDTSGLAVLIEVLRSARQLGKSLQLSGLRERPRYLLESTGLLRLFDEAPMEQ